MSKVNTKYQAAAGPARPKPGAAHGPDRDRAASGLARAAPGRRPLGILYSSWISWIYLGYICRSWIYLDICLVYVWYIFGIYRWCEISKIEELYKQVGYAITIEECHNNGHLIMFYIQTKYTNIYIQNNRRWLAGRPGPVWSLFGCYFVKLGRIL